eukprot:1698169-Amphidinium_carterae.1
MLVVIRSSSPNEVAHGLSKKEIKDNHRPQSQTPKVEQGREASTTAQTATKLTREEHSIANPPTS